MLYQLLAQYIEYQLYTSIEEVHEKIIIHHANGDLTDGEFVSLLNVLFPTVEKAPQDNEIATLEFVEEEQEIHPMPTQALEILQQMVNAKILQNEDHKVDLYKNTGQLTSEQFDTLYPVEDIPTTLPELPEVEPLSIEDLAKAKKITKSRKK